MIFLYTNITVFCHFISFFSMCVVFFSYPVETHNLKLLFHPFAVRVEGELKMLLLSLKVVKMFIIKVKHTSGEGNGNPLQYSCLENSMDRADWQATVHGATKSWTRVTITEHTKEAQY